MKYAIRSSAYGTGFFQGVSLREERVGSVFVGVGATDDVEVALWFAVRDGFTVVPDPRETEPEPEPVEADVDAVALEPEAKPKPKRVTSK
jgi:hypothetical protein